MPAAPADNRVAVGVARLGHPAGATQVREPFERHRVFFFQAEDGIRDIRVTGVQTCALPILGTPVPRTAPLLASAPAHARGVDAAERTELSARNNGAVASRIYVYPIDCMAAMRQLHEQIGRASCRERGSVALRAWTRETA